MNTGASPLTQEELIRYGRHLSLDEVGVGGQAALKAARVLLVGAGGLGSPAALYLAAAGVGCLGLVDDDCVEIANLQRQVLYRTPDVGRRKLAAAAETLRALNPGVTVHLHETRLRAENALEIVRGYDIVLDGTDNFAARYLVNDACFLLGRPNVHGCVQRFEGQVSVFAPGNGPCYRCLFPDPPPPGAVPSCAEAGVLGVLPGVIGLLQATEAIKLILGQGRPLIGQLLLYDALDTTFRTLRVHKRSDCALCGTQPSITQIADVEWSCSAMTTQDTCPEEITAAELKARLDRQDPLCLLDVREPFEYEICSLPTATFIPLGELPARYGELDREKEIVVYCKMGGRSARAAQFLRQQGFARVINLAGGILGWAADVDPAMATY